MGCGTLTKWSIRGFKPPEAKLKPELLNLKRPEPNTI